MDFAAQYKINVNPVGLTGAAATTYKSKVTEHLTWIYLTKVGKILLDCIRFHGLPVEIRPYTGGNCNARGGGETPGGNLRGFVSYSPDTFSLHGACSATQSNPNRGLFWDEILFHELVHVFRNVSKKWNKVPLTGGLTRYDDSEEFLAVMVTNIYISDRTNKIKTGLRQDHKTFNPLEPEFAKPWGFFSSGMQTFLLVRDFVKDNHGFSVMVAHADAPFNPIADFMADSDKAMEMSKKGLGRDVVGVMRDVTAWALKTFH
jgi:hypothetical protein